MSGFDADTLAKLEELSKGPDFIDDADCRCSLQATNVQQSDNSNTLVSEAWRCTKDLTSNPYTGASGKWFVPSNPPMANGLDFAQNQSWAGNPPDLKTSYTLRGPDDRKNGSLVAYNDGISGSNPDDDQCTGRNDTERSFQYYNLTQTHLQNEGTMLTFTCARQSSVAVYLGNTTSFQTNGCPLGFLCEYEMRSLGNPKADSSRPKLLLASVTPVLPSRRFVSTSSFGAGHLSVSHGIL